MKKSFYTISTIMIFAVFIAACAPQHPSAAPAPAITAPPTQAVQVEILTEAPVELTEESTQGHGEDVYLPDGTYPVPPVIEPVGLDGLFKVPMPAVLPDMACSDGTPIPYRKFQFFSRIPGEEWLWTEKQVQGVWQTTTSPLGTRILIDVVDSGFIYWRGAKGEGYRASLDMVTCNGAPPPARYVKLIECEKGVGAFKDLAYTWYNPDLVKGIYHMDAVVPNDGSLHPVNNFTEWEYFSWPSEGVMVYTPGSKVNGHIPYENFLWLPFESKCRPIEP